MNDVAHLLELRVSVTARLRDSGPARVGPRRVATRCRRPHAGPVPEEAWWKLGDIRGMSRRSRGVAQEVAAWRERTAAETNRPRRMILSDLGLLAISSALPATVTSSAEPAGSTAGIWPRAEPPRSSRPSTAALGLTPEQIRCNGGALGERGRQYECPTSEHPHDG